MRPDFEYELKFLQAAGDSLEAYLLSSEIYWPLTVRTPSGYPPYPRFSLGWLLLFQRRLAPDQKNPEAGEVVKNIMAIRDKWRTAWSRKAGREFQSRLRLWTQFLNEYRADRAAHASRYRYEVQRRTMIELLKEEAEEIPSEQRDLLASLDAHLRGSLKPGDFLREPEMAAGFPADRFWFLYGELKS